MPVKGTCECGQLLAGLRLRVWGGEGERFTVGTSCALGGCGPHKFQELVTSAETTDLWFAVPVSLGLTGPDHPPVLSYPGNLLESESEARVQEEGFGRLVECGTHGVPGRGLASTQCGRQTVKQLRVHLV